LASADWMERNLSFRIETVFPVYQADLRKTIKDVIDFQLRDNVKARIVNGIRMNAYKGDVDGDNISIRSQVETYYYFKAQC